MKFDIRASELNKIINIGLKGISPRSTLNVLSGFLLQAKENKLYITATDLEIGVQTYTSCQVYEEGSIVAPARLIGELVKKIDDEHIVFETKQDFNIHITCQSSEFNMMGMDPTEFPTLPHIEEKASFKIKAHILNDMIKKTNFATSEEESKPILKGALFEIEKNKFKMVALDGYRLAYKEEIIDTDIIESFVVPSKTLTEVQRLAEDDDEMLRICFNQSHVLFEIGNTIFISRLLQGQFLNYREVIKINEKATLKINIRQLKKSLERASLFAKEGKNNCVKMEISNHQMKISSQSELGSIKEQIPIEKEGEDLIIAFNAKYVYDGIKSIEEENINMYFVNNLSPSIIKPCEDASYLYLVLPVRLTEA